MEYQTNMHTIELNSSTLNRPRNKEITKQSDVKNNQFGKANVILHAFDWLYADVAKHAAMISQMGYHSVLVSPPLKSFKHQDGTKWWQRYQPQDYRIIDNQLGNTLDFSNMIKQLAKYDLHVYADIVFNHMANEAYLRPDLAYPSQLDLQHYADNEAYYQSLRLFGDLSQPLFNNTHFVEGFGIKDWKNCWEVQNGRITGGAEDPGLPTLKVCEHVIKQQQCYLKALKKLGVKGFRIDAAKHMTLEHLQRVWSKDITENMHVFGEIITDGGATEEEYEIFLQPYLEKTSLGSYDFPLFNTIFEVFEENGNIESLINPYCFGQALVNFRAITFVITHDIPNNDSFKGLVLSEQNEYLAYAYILGRDGGVPLIYADLNTSGIVNEEQQPRWLNAWKNNTMQKMIKFHNYVHGEPMVPILSNHDILIFARGDKGIVVINKSNEDSCIEFQWHRSMQDVLTDQYYSLESEKLHLILEEKSCLMLI